MSSGEADTATAEETEYRQAPSRLLLRGDLPEAELDSLCTELAGGGRPAAVDLDGLGGLEPATLAVLVSSLRRLHRRGICSLAEAIPSAEPGSCLDRRGLAELGKAEGGLWRRCGRGRVLGWHTFASGEGALRAAFNVASRLREDTGWSLPSFAAIAGLAFELGENVRQHSASPEGALALETDASGERMRVAVADAGVGIRASLARNPEHADLDDDLSAIERAVRAGETSEPGTGGGMGLYLTRTMVRGNGGRVLLRSGEASWQESDERRRRRGLSPLRGTLIGIEARTDRPLHDDEIWEQIDALSGPPGVGEH
ncbi:MAG TPA: ATP-binding protein [Solirubrobacterales bacterium]|nr:ATP-binding protein [Solirubrobacterales bacterium]